MEMFFKRILPTFNSTDRLKLENNLRNSKGCGFFRYHIQCLSVRTLNMVPKESTPLTVPQVVWILSVPYSMFECSNLLRCSLEMFAVNHLTPTHHNSLENMKNIEKTISSSFALKMTTRRKAYVKF